jgi:hypothetical protein
VRADMAFAHDDNESVVRAISTPMFFGTIQCRAKEMSRRLTARTVDVEVLEEMAHLGGVFRVVLLG